MSCFREFQTRKHLLLRSVLVLQGKKPSRPNCDSLSGFGFGFDAPGLPSKPRRAASLLNCICPMISSSWRVERDRDELPACTCSEPAFKWISCPMRSDFRALQSMAGLNSCEKAKASAQILKIGDLLHRLKGGLRSFSLESSVRRR
jgi:hypothetical protein